MTSVWPALWPPWKRTTTSARSRQPVDDLALALVAPLGADDRDVAHAPAPFPRYRAGYTVPGGGPEPTIYSAALRKRAVSRAAAIRVRVYSCSGRSKIASVGPCSTIRPLFITMM